MRPVTHRAKPARTADAERHCAPLAWDLGTVGVDQARRAAYEHGATRVLPHGDDRRVADHDASAHPRDRLPLSTGWR